jgi:hypothetical protein
MSIIVYVARECAQIRREQGWQGTGYAYDLGAFPGDAEALHDALGHEPSHDERISLESEIREQLTYIARM